jgi:nucleotide-binding universal stress UspA family protein
MFHHVVVGVDGSPQSQDAIRFARRLAPEAELVLVNAFPYSTQPSRASNRALGDALHEDALKLLAQARDEAGVEAKLRAIADTSPARALQKIAEVHWADAIVVGSAHHGPVGRLLIGDVGRSALHGSPCPVVVVPRGGAPEHLASIAIGYDGSPEAQAALVLAAGLAREASAHLRVVTVAGQPPEMITPMYPYTVRAEDWRGYAEEELLHARRMAEGAAADARGDAEVDVTSGHPAHELVSVSASVDLMVVGSRGWGAARQVLLGSTSNRLMHHAECPVLVVPRGTAETAGDAPAATEAVRV